MLENVAWEDLPCGVYKAVYKKKSSIICVYNIYRTSLKKSKQRKHGPKTAPDGATNVVFSGVMDSFGVIFFDM